MHSKIQAASTTALAVSIAAIDILLWGSVIPFEIFAHRVAVARIRLPATLIGILAVNGFFVACMLVAGVLTVKLVHRGVTLKRLFGRYSPRASARRSGPIQTV